MSSPRRKTVRRRKSTESLAQLDPLFDRAIALTETELKVFLEDIRSSDSKLALELGSLVRSHHKAQDFLSEPIGPKVAASLKLVIQQISPGDVVGDFEILRELGSGGFATVYLARQKSLDRIVALKVSEDRGYEAKAMALLEHDHIVKVFSEVVERSKNIRLICMQYVAGASLERILTELARRPKESLRGATILEIVDENNDSDTIFNPAGVKFRERMASLEFEEAVAWIGSRLADALDYAHQKRILHLDVKPGNILFNAYGRFFLSDFNVSLIQERVDEPTSHLGGTVKYMSPEQENLFGADDSSKVLSQLDGRADIYSLGVLLREFVDVKTPAVAKNTFRFSDNYEHHAAIQLSSVLKRCMNPLPEKRFKTAAELSETLMGCVEICEMEKALPRGLGLLRLSFYAPILTIIFLGLIPQLLGSLVNIFYNEMRIVSQLTVSQQEVFKIVTLYYNLTNYVVGIGIWAWQMLRLKKFLKVAPDEVTHPERAREHILDLPRWVLFVTSLGWVPGGVLFPLLIHINAAPLSATVFGHFFISFALSWLVAVSYSVLYIQFVCLRVLYPQFWQHSKNIRKTARWELRGIGGRLRLYYVFTGFIPLFGAMLLVVQGPEKLDARSYDAFRALTTLLIGIGMSGILVGFNRINQLAQTLAVLTGESSSSGPKPRQVSLS